jgi:hypothetical protein
VISEAETAIATIAMAMQRTRRAIGAARAAFPAFAQTSGILQGLLKRMLALYNSAPRTGAGGHIR